MIHPKYENIWYAREANRVSGVSDVGYYIEYASKCLAAYSGSNRNAKVVKVYNVVPHSVSIIPTVVSISLYIASDVKLYMP